MSLLQPVNQILKVKQWFVPSTFKPPSVLETKLARSYWYNFDYGLWHFGMIADRMETVYYKVKGITTPTDTNSKPKTLYNKFVMGFLIFNILRIFAAWFIQDRTWRMYLGDFSDNWLKKRHIVNGPLIYFTLYTVALNYMFAFWAETKPKLRLWLIPFCMFRGIISPADARVRSVHQLVVLREDIKLNFKYTRITTYLWTIACATLYFTTAIYGYKEEDYPVTITWAFISSVWMYYVWGINCWTLGYFHTLCFYLRCRFKRLNYIVRYLREERTVSIRRRNEFMREVVYEHDVCSNDIGYMNRFWKYYALCCYFTYTPLEFWFLYSAIWVESSWTAWAVLWVLFFQFGIFLGIVIGSGESVANQAHLCYRWINFLCIEEYPVHLKLKICAMIERLGGPTIGFTCYDFFVVARETFYDMIVILGTYFLLVVDFVVSYL